MARPRQIDRPTVLRATLALADEVGLEGVTMQAVAERLGVTPMALYRHVGNKAGLLDGVVESLLDEVPGSPAGAPPEQRLESMGQALRAIARRHPAVFPLLLRLPAATPNARRVRERVYDELRALGVPDEDIPQIERLLSTMILGFAASEASGRFRGHPRRTIDADFELLVQVIEQLVANRAGRLPEGTSTVKKKHPDAPCENEGAQRAGKGLKKRPRVRQ